MLMPHYDECILTVVQLVARYHKSQAERQQTARRNLDLNLRNPGVRVDRFWWDPTAPPSCSTVAPRQYFFGLLISIDGQHSDT